MQRQLRKPIRRRRGAATVEFAIVAPILFLFIFAVFQFGGLMLVQNVLTAALNQSGGVPQVNTKGLRQGLLAYKIIAVGDDIDGSGSVLPELIIEIVDPATVSLDDLEHISAVNASGSFQLVK